VQTGEATLNTLEVAYVLLRFPVLTETFVADEIWEMRRQGVRVRLFSLLRPKEEPVQPTSQELAKDVQYTPELHSGRLWWAQLYFLFRSPIRYVSLWTNLIGQPYPPHSLADLLFKRMFIFLKAVSLAFDLRGTSVQLLHTHFAWLSGAAAQVISGLLNIPFTVTVHAYDIYSQNDLLRLTARSASRIIAISEYNKQIVLKTCPGLNPDSISVVHCGINVGLFTPSPRSNHKGPVAILSVGSLLEKKGHEYLIRACQQLRARGMDLTCTIIGGGPDKEKLRQLVHDCDLESQVILAGASNRNDVLEAYRHNELFVLASVIAQDGDRDGIPVVLMEAMAMHIPVISTRVSGIPELVRHTETGLLAPERDATALAEAIASLVADPALQARLRQNARALVEQEFEIKGNVHQLIEMFRQVIGPPTA
jgi:colanic acid/amylovoran biosynthesis glycosyltransferase